MKNDTWAYCPDRQGTCGLLIADAERMERDAERIADLAEQLEVTKRDLEGARAEVKSLMSAHDAWMEAARVARDHLLEVDTKRSRLLAECRDLERENASLRRRLAVGGR